MFGLVSGTVVRPSVWLSMRFNMGMPPVRNPISAENFQPITMKSGFSWKNRRNQVVKMGRIDRCRMNRESGRRNRKGKRIGCSSLTDILIFQRFRSPNL